MSTAILYPVGRLVWGSLHEPQTKDANGNPLTIKNGPDAGKPTKRWSFGVAIPKQPGEAHWNATPWGATIWQLAHTMWPQGQADWPKFAYKVKDGDSTERNEKGRVISEAAGHAGHWVVSFSSSFPPKVCDARGTRDLTEAEVKAIKRGYYVQVYGTIDSNNNAQKPGMYVNHDRVAFAGYGDEIHTGVDPSTLGFGQGPTPAGMSAAPVSSMQPPPAPVAPSVPPPSAPTPAAVAPPPPTPVRPHPGITAPPPPVPAWKGPAGTTQAAYAAAGWSVEQMRAAGLLG